MTLILHRIGSIDRLTIFSNYMWPCKSQDHATTPDAVSNYQMWTLFVHGPDGRVTRPMWNEVYIFWGSVLQLQREPLSSCRVWVLPWHGDHCLHLFFCFSEIETKRPWATFGAHYCVLRHIHRPWKWGIRALQFLLITEQCLDQQPQCELGHCGKDDSGQYRPAKWSVVYIHDDDYLESNMGVCNMCVNAFRGRRTKTKLIIRVVPLVSQANPLELSWPSVIYNSDSPTTVTFTHWSVSDCILLYFHDPCFFHMIPMISKAFVLEIL